MTNKEFNEAVGKVLGVKAEVLSSVCIKSDVTGEVRIQLLVRPTERQFKRLKPIVLEYTQQQFS